MRIQEEYIVPGLGVVILLSVIGFMTSGASIVHLALLTLLGSAAVGTYFLPHAVQIELRVVIAALGLLILLLYFSNLAFWLALLAFGAIGALQIRHSDALQMFPQHTIAWVKGKLGQEVAMGTGASEAGAGDGAGQATQTGEPSEAGEAAGTPAAQGLTAMPGGLNIFQGGVKPRIGRIAASAHGRGYIAVCFHHALGCPLHKRRVRRRVPVGSGELYLPAGVWGN